MANSPSSAAASTTSDAAPPGRSDSEVLELAQQKYKHLIVSDWDRQFFQQASYVTWFEAQNARHPIPPGQELARYVRDRVQAMQAQQPQSQAATTATAGKNDASQATKSTVTAEPVASTSSSNAPGSVARPAMSTASTSSAVSQPQNTAQAPASSQASPAPTQPSQQQQPQDDVNTYFNMASYSPDSTPSNSQQSASFAVSPSFAAPTPTAQAYQPYAQQQQQQQQQQPSQASYGGAFNTQQYYGSANTTGQQSYAIDPSLVSGQQQSQPNYPKFQGISPNMISASPVAHAQWQHPPVASTSTAVAPSMLTTTTSSTPTTPGSTSAPTPGERKTWFSVQNELLDIISDANFAKAKNRAATKLSKLLSSFRTRVPKNAPADQAPQSAWGDESDVPPSGRVLVLRAMLKHGDDDFWNAWYRDPSAMETVVTWFAGAARKRDDKVSKDDRKYLDVSLVLLLQVFVRLPFTRKALASQHKIGARVKRLSETAKNKEVQQLSKQLVDHWSSLSENAASSVSALAASSNGNSAATKQKGKTAADPLTAVKRKAVTATSEGPATKKAKPAESKPVPAVKATTTAAAAASVGASAAAPLASVSLGGLRSFKKATPKSEGTAVDAFSSILESLDKKNPPLSAADPTKIQTSLLTSAVGSGSSGLGKRVKEKKSVRWVEDDKLVAVKFFEVERDGDEHGNELVHDVKMMDEQEGVTLSMHLEQEMEEDLEWYEDIPAVEVPSSPDFDSYRTSAHVKTPAVEAEENRLAGVVLPTPDDAPTPGSPLPASVANDFSTVTMMLSKELKEDPDVQTAIVRAQAAPSPSFGLGARVGNEELSTLLSQLGSQGLLPSAAAAAASSSGTISSSASAYKNVLPPGVSQLTQSLSSGQSHVVAPSMDPTKLAQLAAQLDPIAIASLSQQLTSSPFAPASSAFATTNGSNANGGNAWLNVLTAGGSSAGGVAGQLQQLQQNGQAAAGKRKKTKCKFFNTLNGCDRGSRCAHVHDRGNGQDVRD